MNTLLVVNLPYRPVKGSIFSKQISGEEQRLLTRRVHSVFKVIELVQWGRSQIQTLFFSEYEEAAVANRDMTPNL